jgi:hypothetical protein
MMKADKEFDSHPEAPLLWVFLKFDAWKKNYAKKKSDKVLRIDGLQP